MRNGAGGGGRVGGERGNISYAYKIVYKLNYGRGCPVPTGGERGNIWPQEREGCSVPQGGEGGKHMAAG